MKEIDFQSYYDQQAKGFNNPSFPIYRSGIHWSQQYGYGLGGILARLFRTTVVPLLKKGAKTVGKRVLETGAKVAHDVIVDRQDLGSSVRKRAREAFLPSFMQQETREPPFKRMTKVIKILGPPSTPISQHQSVGSGTSVRCNRKRVKTTKRDILDTI